MPATVAPDRVPVASRERSHNGRGGAQGRERETDRNATNQHAEESVPTKDQLKANRLDISA
jgi:hypothetical protein